MKIQLPPTGCGLLIAALLSISPAVLHAQSAWVGPTNGLWNDATNWSAGVPNFQDSEADFNGPASVDVNGATVDVGTILMAATNASDAVTISNGTVNLNVSFGTPSVSVGSAAGNSLFMYANVTGAGGLRKDGPGKFTFRFNPNNQTYSGGIFLNGGTFGINQAGSMGDADNDVTVETSSVFRFEPGGDSNSIILGTGHDFILNSGTTLTVQNSGSNTVSGEIQGVISGDANLSFLGSGTLTLSGTNTFAGATTVAAGTLVVNQPLAATNATTLSNGAQLVLGAGASFSTNNLVMVGTAPSTVNLGGNTQTIRNFAATNATNTPAVLTNGSIVIAGDANQSFGATVNGGGTDMTGLANFTYSRTNRDFTVNATGTNVTNNFFLAKSGTNAISATNLRIGGGGLNTAAGQNSLVRLGQVNLLNAANEVLFGFFQGSASASFHAGLTNPTLTIRGAAGDTNPVPLFRVGLCNSGSQSSVGSLDLTGGSLDVVASAVDVGAHIASTAVTNVVGGTLATGTLVMPGGTMITPTLSIGYKTNNGNPQITGTLTQGGGTVEATTVYLGNNLQTNGTAIPRFISSYNMNGGVLRAATITAGSGIAGTNFFTNSVRRINWSAGTIRPLNAATNLVISGVAGTGGSVEIPTIGPATKTFTADGSNGITLSSTTWLVANGGDVLVDPGAGGFFTGAGAVTIGSGNFASTNATFTNAANASVTVASGTASFATDTRIFGIGDRTVAGVTNAFNVTGGAASVNLSANRMLVGNRSIGQVNVTGGSLVITGNQPIYIGGDFSFGTTGARGSLNIGAAGSVTIGGSGTVILGQANTNASSTDIEGAINLNGGSLTTARPITAAAAVGTNVSSGTVNFNGGVFAAGGGVANILNVTTATVTSNGLTYNTGTFDSGMTQNLAGTGTLTVTGTGTLRLNGTNTPPVVVTNGATLGGTGSAGTVTANGTFAPGAPATNGTFTVTSSLDVPGTARFRVFGNAINDKVIASGGAGLGGTVQVVVDTNYTPASGDSYDLVDGAISGSPALSLPALGGGLTWVTNAFLSTGVLSVTNGGPVNNYANWVAYWQTNSAGFTNTAGTDNPDGDPYDNNEEFAFDGNPTVGSPALLTAVKVGTNTVFNFVARKNPPGGVTYQVQFTGNLTNSWANSPVTVSNSANTNGINIPADYERKEFTVPAAGSEFYRVEAAIAP